jgi:peroxidase
MTAITENPAAAPAPVPQELVEEMAARREAASRVTGVEYRSVTAHGNNLANPSLGSAPGLMQRGDEGADYADGMRRPHDRGNERSISNKFHALKDVLVDPHRAHFNMVAVLFGQLLNHDLEENRFFGHNVDNNKSFVTPDSPYQFVWILDENDPIATFRGQNRIRDGVPCGVPFKPTAGAFVDGVFRPGTITSAFLDLSQVYGPDEHTVHVLREYSGGRMLVEDFEGTSNIRTEFGPLQVDYSVKDMPVSRATTELHVDSTFSRLPGNEVCTGGDPRVSENMGLLMMQTMFLREHNRQAGLLAEQHPEWDDEILYQEARRRCVALWQHLLLDEWAPTLFGPDMAQQLGEYRGYQPDVDPATRVVFATLALRAAHSLLFPYAPRNEDGSISTLSHEQHQWLRPDGTLPNVGQCNNATSPMAHFGIAQGGPEHILRGMLATAAKHVGLVYHEEIHDIAFVSGGTDLMTLDLARGRDNGLPPYHVVRDTYAGSDDVGGWESVAQADTITEKEKRAMIDAGKRLDRRTPIEMFLRFTANDPQNPTHDELVIAEKIREVYLRADSIDPMMGALAEPHVEGSAVGRTMQNILADELIRSRDGDRFWYENGQFSDTELAEIKATTMRDMLLRNFDLDPAHVPAQAFETLTIWDHA